jgi:hypothetical protein
VAHLGFARTVYKSGGREASKRLDYITRRTVQTPAKAVEQLRYLKAEREDLIAEGTHNLPVWAGGSADVFFQAAERYEGGGPRRQHIAFEEWKLTLPQELTQDQNKALVEALVDAIAGSRLPCTWAMHEPRTLDGAQPQPHMHLLLSMRLTDRHERSAAQHFKRFQRQTPARGGAEKDRLLGQFGGVKAARVLISDVINVHLEQHGVMSRVHPDRLKARGIDREPEPKLLPSEGRAFKKGIVTEGMEKVQTIRQARARHGPHEQNNARLYWEQRKQYLGLTRDMPPAHQLAQILLKRHGTVERLPERHRQLLQPPTTQHQPSPLHALLARAQQLGRGREEQAMGRRMRVRLHDEERGMQW